MLYGQVLVSGSVVEGEKRPIQLSKTKCDKFIQDLSVGDILTFHEDEEGVWVKLIEIHHNMSDFSCAVHADLRGDSLNIYGNEIENLILRSELKSLLDDGWTVVEDSDMNSKLARELADIPDEDKSGGNCCPSGEEGEEGEAGEEDVEEEGDVWKLEGRDSFSNEDYSLEGTYETASDAVKAGQKRLKELEESQPSASSGGQSGIQDQVFIVHPSGRKQRVFPE
jgi:hypothetical protein